MGEKKRSKLMRFLYAAFNVGSMAQLCHKLWPLQNWLYQTKRQKKTRYTAAITEAEGASERAAALALKRDVLSTHWAWGRDFLTTIGTSVHGRLRHCGGTA
jgi:predicted mannosyl-3-phosphoglycerate phosphatase (HAD superfamily)